MQIQENDNDYLNLELTIDRHGLSAVLDALASICGAKADHLRANWQDAASASVWDKDGRKIASVAGKVQT